MRAADGRLRGPGRPRREGAARGAAPACPAAAVSSPGDGGLEKEQDDQAAEIVGASLRCLRLKKRAAFLKDG